MKMRNTLGNIIHPKTEYENNCNSSGIRKLSRCDCACYIYAKLYFSIKDTNIISQHGE